VGKIYDSFIKMYLGDDDAYRKIGVANTYQTVGVDRDSTAQDLKENLYLKLGTRIAREKIDRMRSPFFLFFLFFLFSSFPHLAFT
jgi:hypothetical protein